MTPVASEQMPVGSRTLATHRVLAASPGQVYAAFISAERLPPANASRAYPHGFSPRPQRGRGQG